MVSYVDIIDKCKDIRIIILYAVPISLWPTLGKENRYFYTRHPNTNDRWINAIVSQFYEKSM